MNQDKRVFREKREEKKSEMLPRERERSLSGQRERKECVLFCVCCVSLGFAFFSYRKFSVTFIHSFKFKFSYK